jgi:hypothetical protein
MNYKSTIAGCFGASINRNFSEKIAIRLELIYSMHNQSYDGTFSSVDIPYGFGNGASYTDETKMNYLDIPILFHLGKKNSPFLEVGPQFGFLMSAKQDFTYTPATGSAVTVNNSDFKSDFNSSNIAGIIGFGYNFSVVGLLSIDLGLRVGYGFTDVTKSFPETDWYPKNTSANVEHSYTSIYAHYNSFNQVPGNFGYTTTTRLWGSFLIGASIEIP